MDTIRKKALLQAHKIINELENNGIIENLDFLKGDFVLDSLTKELEEIEKLFERPSWKQNYSDNRIIKKLFRRSRAFKHLLSLFDLALKVQVPPELSKITNPH